MILRKVLHIGDEMIDLKNKVFLDSDGEMTFENKERLNFIMHFMKKGAVEQVATNKDGTFVREDAEISFNEIWLPCAELKAKQQATPEGFVLISKKLSDDLNDHLWDFMTDNFISTNEDGDSYIACDDFDLRKFYSEIIEAKEQSHDNSN